MLKFRSVTLLIQRDPFQPRKANAEAFCPSSTVPGSPRNTLPSFGTTVCRTCVPALSRNVVPAGFASTFAWMLSPGKIAIPAGVDGDDTDRPCDPVLPLLVAAIDADPAATAVTNPEVDTVAT